MPKKRVLALAFDCNPKWPSLPVVAYKYALALGEDVELTLVTQILNKPNLEEAGTGSMQVDYINIDLLAVPLDRFGKWLRGGNELGWTTQIAIVYPVYIVFELVCWWRFRRRLSRGEFDLVHRITPMTPTLPSPMARLSPVPFILGPLNGGLQWPPTFRSMEKKEKEWLRPLRALYKKLPFSRSTFRCSAAVLASFNHTVADLPPEVLPKTIDFPEVGIDERIFSTVEPRALSTGPLTVAFIGRFAPFKLPEVAALAFARSAVLREHRLVYVGDGPERPHIEGIIREHSLQDCAHVTGWVTQKVVGDWMRRADIMAFPSIRELGAGVVVEAMACGMVPLVCNYGAPGTLVGTDRGVRVPVKNREQIINAFQIALEELVTNRQRLKDLADRAQRFAIQKFSWRQKSKETIAIYDWVLCGRRGQKPVFWSEDP
jgi:glycosyltransferase involved in cell wall biosynthesis